MFKPNAATIYLGDNGRAYCGEHLGVSARMTGRDISGQKIYALTPEDAQESERYGVTIRCERCGKKASLLLRERRRHGKE